MSATRVEDSGLVRAVSRWQLVGLAINDVVGSGVYLLPAAAAALLGAASVWAVMLAGFAVLLLVLCFAEASSYFDQPGGAYLYTREAFGPFIGFEVGWMTWLARVASIASLSNGLALAVAYFWPGAAAGWGRAGVIAGLILIFAAINVQGVTGGARTAVVLVVTKMMPLVFFVIVGAFFVDTSAFGFEMPPLNTLGKSALLLLFAYAGFENTPAAAGEYKNPRSDVPFALLSMILIVTLVYSGVQIVALGTLPDLAHASSPLAAAAGRFAGHWGALLLTVGAVLSIAGNVGNTTLIAPRYLYALAADGYGPRWLAGIHPRFRTPAAAIVGQTLIVLVLALSGSFVELAILSVIARLATYIGTAAAVPVLRRRFANRSGAVRLPGGAAIPVAALLIAIALLASARPANLIGAAAALAFGALIYLFRRSVSVAKA
ncbi:MAG TPA: APC family permease [Gammaproteobacteria bacterium]|nr:APC family permease [Gammaproteobacteria bacterium]